MMGASKLLVRFTVRMSPFSFVPEEIAIWLVGGGVARALLMSVPSGGGDPPRLDMLPVRVDASRWWPVKISRT